MIFTLNFLFRIATLILLFLWWLYWAVTEKEADRQKPKMRAEGVVLRNQQIRRFILRFADVIMVLQVLGLQLLSFPLRSLIVQLIGFIFVLIGVSMSISARKTLGTNWTHAFEYQIKNKHELVTNGIYAYVRHPIYSGLCVGFIGGELVAQSYLVIIGFLLLIGGYWQARQEESILIQHFGNSYKTYMKHTKMFLPYLW